MKNFLGTVIVLALFGAGMFASFYYLDPDFRFRYERMFPPAKAPAIPQPTIETKHPAKAHVRRAEAEWQAIDQHAIATPAAKAVDIPTLTRHLVLPAKDDWEKARAIFRWIAEYIHYDDVKYNAGIHTPPDAEATLRTRKGVCGDYAALFKEMTAIAGLKAEVVGGWSKQSDFQMGTLDKEDHGWNAVYLDDQWHLLDVTWAAGHGEKKDGRLVSIQEYNPMWFDVPPSAFVFRHLPSDSTWQLLDRPISFQEFQQMPVADASLFAMGFSSTQLLDAVRNGQITAFPLMYDHPFTVKALAVPYQGELPVGQKITFQFECPDCDEMMAVNSGEHVEFSEKDEVFSLTFKPEKGKLEIFAKKNKKERRYQGIMAYEVKRGVKPIPVQTQAKVEEKQPVGWGKSGHHWGES